MARTGHIFVPVGVLALALNLRLNSAVTFNLSRASKVNPRVLSGADSTVGKEEPYSKLVTP